MQKVLLCFLCMLTYVCAFPTNVREAFIWKTKSIDFVIMCEDDERAMLFKLIYETVTELNKAVGKQLIQWSEVSRQEATSKKRFIMFVLERYECGETGAVSQGGFYLPLSISPECNNATNLRNLLAGLGFVYTHLRPDRDDFIDIHWDNIYHVDQQIYDKCSDCMQSSNEAFAVYDYNSILHFPQYSIYAKNETLPIFTPKHSNVAMNNNWKEKSFTAQDVLIFKAIYE